MNRILHTENLTKGDEDNRKNSIDRWNYELNLKSKKQKGRNLIGGEEEGEEKEGTLCRTL